MSDDFSSGRTAVVGLGTMGAGIAHVFGGSGPVVVADATVEDARARLNAFRDRVESDVALNRRDAAELAIIDRIEAAGLEDAVRDAALVVEAVPESWAVKEAVLASIGAAAGPETVIASNTSSFPIQRLASVVKTPERFLGVHFFNPAELVPGVEVVATDVTADFVVSSVLARLRGAGKVPVLVRDSPGFVANRLQLALFVEAMACVDEGLIDATDLDALVRTTFGFRLPAYGPFEVADMAGLDVYAAILDTLRAAFGERFVTPASLAAHVADGRLGLKTGAGFALYPDAETDKVLAGRDARYRAIAHALESPDSHPSFGADLPGTSGTVSRKEEDEKG